MERKLEKIKDEVLTILFYCLLLFVMKMVSGFEIAVLFGIAMILAKLIKIICKK